MERADIPDIVARLGRVDDSSRKMAAFKLQSAIGDPSFADVFVQQGGGPKLRDLCLNATGNTLAYGLASLGKLLELDLGWASVTGELIERVC